MARLLCVDDDATALRLKCSILEKAGYLVTPAAAAEEALTQLDSAQFDAIVTDWRMGNGSGHAVVAAAKEKYGVPVVVVSGYIAEAFQAAKPMADLYLEKPVNPEELVKIISTLLGTAELL